LEKEKLQNHSLAKAVLHIHGLFLATPDWTSGVKEYNNFFLTRGQGLEG
jgi:hypothetical protein